MYRNCILEESNHFTINSIWISFCINIEVKSEKCDFTDKGGCEQANFHDVSTLYAFLNISYGYVFIQIFINNSLFHAGKNRRQTNRDNTEKLHVKVANYYNLEMLYFFGSSFAFFQIQILYGFSHFVLLGKP